MELVIIRHSWTAGNEEHRYIGHTDVPLTERGIKLAKATAAIVPEVSHVYVSPLTRCRHTAQLLWDGVRQTVIDDLIEMNFGPFEGGNHAELTGTPLYDHWVDTGRSAEIEGLESIEECTKRAVGALQRIVSDATEQNFAGRIGILSHGGTLNCLLAELGCPKRERFYDWGFANCSGYIMRVDSALTELQLIDTFKSAPEDAEGTV